MNIICWTSRSLSNCLSVKRREIPKWNSRKKNYLQQTFPFGCSLSLCSFSLFLGFSFLPKVFSIQFFFGHRSHCRTVHSVSFWLFVFRFYSLDRAFCVCVCFSSLSNGSHSTGPFKETTPRLRYPKTKHTFSTFRRIHASLFVSQLLIFFFRSSSLHFLHRNWAQLLSQQYNRPSPVHIHDYIRHILI